MRIILITTRKSRMHPSASPALRGLRRNHVCQAIALLGTSAALGVSAQSAPADGTAPAAPTEASVLAPVKATAQSLDSYTVKETASATKLTLSPRETPQSVTVITRERLDDQNL